jgi:hypothetical protein
MERKSMENIWKGNAWKIYGKGKHGKHMERKSTGNIWKGGNYKMIVRGLKERGG